MNFLKVSVIGLLLGICQPVVSQSPVGIVDHIIAGHVNTVVQPEALSLLLAPPPPKNLPAAPDPDDETEHQDAASQPAQPSGIKTVGYRIQVFSDNNSRTAKNEARSKQRAISARCPHYRTYVTYTSPYWRLKVGDFKSQQEAAEAVEELKRLFPSYSKEMRIVRDRINVSN